MALIHVWPYIQIVMTLPIWKMLKVTISYQTEEKTDAAAAMTLADLVVSVETV